MQHAAVREVQGEEGQHWLVAHASQILLMVISTFIYALCKSVVDGFAKSAGKVVLLELKRWFSVPTTPKSPTKPPTELTAEPTTESPAKPPTKPLAEPTTESPVKPIIESPAKPPTKLPAKLTTEPPAKPPTEPLAKPTIESPAKPPTNLPAELTTEPPAKPPTEPLVKPPAKPPTEPFAKPNRHPAKPPTEPLTPEPPSKPPAQPAIRPPVVPRPSPSFMRDTLEFEKKGNSVTLTTLRQSLKYADVEHAACESPVSIRRAGDTIIDTGIEHLLASLKPSHIKQVRAVLWTFEGDLEHLRELIMTQYLSSEGGSLARFVDDCPASLQSELQRVLRLKKNAATRQITTGIVLLGAHHYFQKFPNHLKKDWCRHLNLKVGGNAAELEGRLMSHFFAEWEINAWLELRRSLVSRAHESYPVLSESEEEEEEAGEVEDDSAGLESDDDQPLSTWADKIEWVLQQYLGATLSEIYCDIEGEFPEDIAGKPHWRAAVRSCLSTNTRKGRFVVVNSPDGRAWSLGH